MKSIKADRLSVYSDGAQDVPLKFEVRDRRAETNSLGRLHEFRRSRQAALPLNGKKQTVAVAAVVILFLLTLCFLRWKKSFARGTRLRRRLAEGRKSDQCNPGGDGDDAADATEQRLGQGTSEDARQQQPAQPSGAVADQLDFPAESPTPHARIVREPAPTNGEEQGLGAGTRGEEAPLPLARGGAEEEASQAGPSGQETRTADASDESSLASSASSRPSKREKKTKHLEDAPTGSSEDVRQEAELKPEEPSTKPKRCKQKKHCGSAAEAGSRSGAESASVPRKVSSDYLMQEMNILVVATRQYRLAIQAMLILHDAYPLSITPQEQNSYDELFFTFEFLSRLVLDHYALVRRYVEQIRQSVAGGAVDDRQYPEVSRMVQNLSQTTASLFSLEPLEIRALEHRSAEAEAYSERRDFMRQMRVYCRAIMFLERYSEVEIDAHYILDLNAAAPQAPPEFSGSATRAATPAATGPESAARGPRNIPTSDDMSFLEQRLQQLHSSGTHLLRKLDRYLFRRSVKSHLATYKLLMMYMRTEFALVQIESRLKFIEAATAANTGARSTSCDAASGFQERSSSSSSSCGGATTSSQASGSRARVFHAISGAAIDTSTTAGLVTVAVNSLRMQALRLAMFVRDANDSLAKLEAEAEARARARDKAFRAARAAARAATASSAASALPSPRDPQRSGRVTELKEGDEDDSDDTFYELSSEAEEEDDDPDESRGECGDKNDGPGEYRGDGGGSSSGGAGGNTGIDPHDNSTDGGNESNTDGDDARSADRARLSNVNDGTHTDAEGDNRDNSDTGDEHHTEGGLENSADGGNSTNADDSNESNVNGGDENNTENGNREKTETGRRMKTEGPSEASADEANNAHGMNESNVNDGTETDTEPVPSDHSGIDGENDTERGNEYSAYSSIRNNTDAGDANNTNGGGKKNTGGSSGENFSGGGSSGSMSDGSSDVVEQSPTAAVAIETELVSQVSQMESADLRGLALQAEEEALRERHSNEIHAALVPAIQSVVVAESLLYGIATTINVPGPQNEGIDGADVGTGSADDSEDNYYDGSQHNSPSDADMNAQDHTSTSNTLGSNAADSGAGEGPSDDHNMHRGMINQDYASSGADGGAAAPYAVHADHSGNQQMPVRGLLRVRLLQALQDMRLVQQMAFETLQRLGGLN